MSPSRHGYRSGKWVRVAIAVVICALVASGGVLTAYLLRDRGWNPALGVNVYVSDITNDSDTKYMARADRDFEYLNKLGANAVSLFFPVFTDGPRGNTVSVKAGKTPPPERLRLVVRSAQRHRLRVTMRPAIDQTNLMVEDGQWRGTLEPQNRDKWFSSYLAVLKPYLEMAEDLHVEQFDIGLELNTLEGDRRWGDVVRQATAWYHGTLSYSVHWETFQDEDNQLPTARFGINAYPSLDLPDNASQDRITAAWVDWLEAVGKGHDLSEVSLDEVGIPATNGAYKRPWEWDDDSMRLVPEIQRRWFTAACAAMKQKRMAGIYFWKIDFDQEKFDPATAPPTHFVGRPGEEAIRQCFAG